MTEMRLNHSLTFADSIINSSLILYLNYQDSCCAHVAEILYRFWLRPCLKLYSEGMVQDLGLVLIGLLSCCPGSIAFHSILSELSDSLRSVSCLLVLSCFWICLHELLLQPIRTGRRSWMQLVWASLLFLSRWNTADCCLNLCFSQVCHLGCGSWLAQQHVQGLLIVLADGCFQDPSSDAGSSHCWAPAASGHFYSLIELLGHTTDLPSELLCLATAAEAHWHCWRDLHDDAGWSHSTESAPFPLAMLSLRYCLWSVGLARHSSSEMVRLCFEVDDLSFRGLCLGQRCWLSSLETALIVNCIFLRVSSSTFGGCPIPSASPYFSISRELWGQWSAIPETMSFLSDSAVHIQNFLSCWRQGSGWHRGETCRGQSFPGSPREDLAAAFLSPSVLIFCWSASHDKTKLDWFESISRCQLSGDLAMSTKRVNHSSIWRPSQMGNLLELVIQYDAELRFVDFDNYLISSPILWMNQFVPVFEFITFIFSQTIFEYIETGDPNTPWARKFDSLSEARCRAQLGSCCSTKVDFSILQFFQLRFLWS